MHGALSSPGLISGAGECVGAEQLQATGYTSIVLIPE